MFRTSIIFSLFLFAIVFAVFSTVYLGIQSRELENKIVNPIKSVAENFAEQAAKVPVSEITPIPATHTINYRTNPDIEKKNMYMKSINEAYMSWGEGKDNDVISHATEALNLASVDQDKGVAHYWIGLGYYRLGDFKKSESEENLAIQLYPTFSPPYITLSAISMNRGDYLNGLTLAQKAQEIDPKNPWAYNDQGIALVELGRKADGLEMFRKAVQLSPDTYIFKDNLTRAQSVH